VVFLVATGFLRAGQGGVLVFFRGLGRNGPDRARLGRYVYIVAALALPAIALAAQTIMRRWRQATIVVVVLAAVAVAGNVEQFVTFSRNTQRTQRSRIFILDAPRLPLAAAMPRSLEVANDLTMGWLIDNFRAGRLPSPGPRTPDQMATETLNLVLKVTGDPPRNARTRRCRPLDGPSAIVMRADETLFVKAGIVNAVYAPTGGGRSISKQLPWNILSRSVVALAGPLRLLIAPPPGYARPVVVCGPTQSARSRS
jgi:hypothetical protein